VHIVITAVPGEVQTIAISVSVCLVRPHYVYQNFTKFSVLVTRGHGLILLWWQCNTLYTSGFVDDVIFSHNTAYMYVLYGEGYSRRTSVSGRQHTERV